MKQADSKFIYRWDNWRLGKVGGVNESYKYEYAEPRLVTVNFGIASVKMLAESRSAEFQVEGGLLIPSVWPAGSNKKLSGRASMNAVWKPVS